MGYLYIYIDTWKRHQRMVEILWHKLLVFFLFLIHTHSSLLTYMYYIYIYLLRLHTANPHSASCKIIKEFTGRKEKPPGLKVVLHKWKRTGYHILKQFLGTLLWQNSYSEDWRCQPHNNETGSFTLEELKTTSQIIRLLQSSGKTPSYAKKIFRLLQTHT